MKPKVFYQIYIEGKLHEETTSLKRARSLQQRFEREGWNVKVLRQILTIVGYMGVQI